MRIAFITPNIDGSLLDLDRPLTPMAPAMLGGFLRAYGHTDIRQYDFNGAVRDRWLQGRIDPAVFQDAAAVDAFLAGGEGGLVQEQARRMLDALEVQPADLYALSCALASSTSDGAEALLNTVMSLATMLERRFPGCAIVIGGPFFVSESEHIARFRAALERCPALDFAVVGEGEVPLLRIVEHLEGAPGKALASTHPRLELRGRGTLLLRADEGFERVAPDVQLGMLRVRGTEEMFREPAEGRFTTVPPRIRSIFCPPLFDLRRPPRTGSDLIADYMLTGAEADLLAPYAGTSARLLPLKFINGCSGRCAFCAYSTINMDRWDVPAVIRTLASLREQHDCRSFQFFNTSINPSYALAESFCDALIEADLGINWGDSLNLRHLDERLMDKLAQSGFVRAAIGAEAASDGQLRQFSKLGLTAQTMHTRLRQLHERGIWNHAQFVAGFPWESPGDVAQTVDFIRATAEYCDAYSVMPFRVEPVSRITFDPARWGVELLHEACDSPGFGTYEYRELEGGPRDNPDFTGSTDRPALSREDKRRATLTTLRTYYQAIQLAKRSEIYAHHGLHFELVFWLYQSLGRSDKAEILRIFESGNPMGPARGPVDEGLAPSALHPRLARLVAALDARPRPFGFGGFPLVSVALRGGAPGGRVELVLADGASQIVMVVCRSDSRTHPVIIESQGYAIEQNWSLPLDSRERMKAVQELARFMVVLSRA